MLDITKHLVHRRETPSCSGHLPRRSSNEVANFRCRTRQLIVPPSATRDLGVRLDDFRRRLCFVCARHHTKCCVSLNLPPMSPAMTTIVALLPIPHSSGFQQRSVCMVRESVFPCTLSNSLTMTLVDTLAPHSQQIWATTLSTAKPLLLTSHPLCRMLLCAT